MKLVRKRFCIFLVVLLLISSAYVHAFAHIPCQCNNPPDQCTCFIQLGDKGFAVKRIIEILNEKGYLNGSVKKSEFTPEVREAVIQFQMDCCLNITGWMDDETLDALLLDVLPEKHSVQYGEGIYYVPTDGGIRFHSDPTCCDMYNPRMISGVNAQSLGMEHCHIKSCIDCDELTYAMLGLSPRELPDDYYLDDMDIKLSESSFTRSLFDDSSVVMYIGNKKSHVFHLESCGSVKKMNENNKVEFDSRDEAVAEGYKPCSNCNP